MKILTPGHRYVLANFENPELGQTIQFIEKAPSTSAPDFGKGLLVTVNDGTTNEEVLKCLLDRLEHLYDRFPSDETAYAIDHLKQALYALQSRTLDRMNRGVEGKHLK